MLCLNIQTFFAYLFLFCMFTCDACLHVIIAAEDLREKSFQRRTLSERKPKNKNSKLRNSYYFYL